MWYSSTLLIYKQDNAVNPATQAVHYCARRITVGRICTAERKAQLPRLL